MKAKDIYASTKGDAARLGMSFFRTDRVCRNNHTDEDGQPALKSTITGNCVQCQADSRRKATDAIRRAMYAARTVKPTIRKGGK